MSAYTDPHADGFYVTAQKSRIDLTWVTNTLLGTYWGTWRTHEIIAESIRNSLCFSLFEHRVVEGSAPHEDRQIGFARVVTDYATFSYLCDVVIHPEYRRRGLGKFLVATIVNTESLRGTVFTLKTRDAHPLYEKLGFVKCEAMTRKPQ
jgi:GNAT superfamily N-acetyltransferase